MALILKAMVICMLFQASAFAGAWEKAAHTQHASDQDTQFRLQVYVIDENYDAVPLYTIGYIFDMAIPNTPQPGMTTYRWEMGPQSVEGNYNAVYGVVQSGGPGNWTVEGTVGFNHVP